MMQMQYKLSDLVSEYHVRHFVFDVIYLHLRQNDERDIDIALDMSLFLRLL